MDSKVTIDVAETIADMANVSKGQVLCTNSLKVSIVDILAWHGFLDQYLFDERQMVGTDCVQCIVSLLDDDLFQLPQDGADPVEVKVMGGTRKIGSEDVKRQLLNYPKWHVAVWALSNYHVYDDDMLGRMGIGLLYTEIKYEVENNPDLAWLKGML